MSITLYVNSSDGFIQHKTDGTYAVNDTWVLKTGYSSSDGVFRSFLFFDNPGISGYVKSAELHIKSYLSYNPAHTVEAHNTGVTPPLAASSTQFADIGDLLGSVDIPANTASAWYTITLNGLLNLSNNPIRIALKDADEAPSSDNWLAYYAYEGGASVRPYLVLTTTTVEIQNMSLFPLSDKNHTLFSGTFYDEDGNNSSKIQIQVADTADFSNILFDTGIISKVAASGGTIQQILSWFPDSQGTYYVRAAAWDSTVEGQNPVWKNFSFTVGYPEISNITYSNSKEQFTFQTVVKDTYTKPPIVSLVVDNNSYLMELKNREGIGGLAGWKYNRKIIIDHTKIDEDLSNFPVLVKLTSSNFDFSKAKSDGTDIRFTLADNTLLDFEREKHDSSGQEAEYWVKIPSVSSSVDTIFYIQYGNPSATDGANPTAVWDSHYKAVYHLSESGTDTRKDSTANGNNGTPKNGVAGATGKIDGANSFDGVDDYIQTSLTPPKPITIETWFNLNGYPDASINNNTEAFIARSGAAIYFSIMSSSHLIRFIMYNSGANSLFSSMVPQLHTWYYVAGIYDGTTNNGSQKLYINGDLDVENAAYSDTYGSTSYGFTFGAQSDDYNHLDGLLDEIRISDIVRSPAWIKASYYSGNNNLLSVGSEAENGYFYTFSKNITLEKGQHEYHIEVGNVWTTLIDDSREMSADYNTNNMSIQLFSNTSKINAFNIVLTDKLLPDFSELSFDSKDEIGTQTITAIVDTNGIYMYSFDIQSIERKQNGVNTYKCVATEKKDFEQIMSISSEVINSLDLLKSILPGYRFIGTLEENITLQQFVDMKIKDIFSFVLVLNNKKAYVRNKTVYISDTNTKGKVFKNDIGVTSFTEDRSKIVNKLREYYAIKQYPVPKNAITLLDASNWSGTVSDVQMTSTGLIRNNPYFLKAVDTISRTVDFNIADFDHITLAWNPETASSLEIRLETDASNYYHYVHSFGGRKGAGFVLTGDHGDVLSKSITFTQTKISKVEGRLSDVATTRITLKKSGVIVGQSEWQTGTYFGQVFSNIDADEIYLEFKNSYVVNNAFGVNCYQLSITQYVQEYQTTGSKTFTVFSHHYSGSFSVSHPAGTSELIGSDVNLGSAYPLNSYDKQTISGYANAYVVTKDNNGTFHYNVSVPMPYTVKIQNGSYILDVGTGTYPSNATAAYNTGHYEIDIRVDRTVSTGEYVWVYKPLNWSETYNLWDEFSIGLNNFSKIGSPSSQINTIRLVASGTNYYDEIYLTTSSPNVKYVEYQDDNSIAEYGERFQIRKTDGWSSKESAYSFAKGYVELYKEPLISISRKVHIINDVKIGDAYDYNGRTLYVYKVVQDWLKGTKTVFYGSETSNTLEFFKLIAHKIEALERSVL